MRLGAGRAGACVILGVIVAVAAASACRGGPDRDAYVEANEAIFRALRVFPGARVQERTSSPATAQEGTVIVGYVTRFVLTLPAGARAEDVVSFYVRRLQPAWRVVETLDGPVVNFRRGPAAVSVNLENARLHLLEIAVDHDATT